MPISVPDKIDYTELSDSIQVFSKISQIDTSFYDFSDTLLKDGNIYHGLSDIQHKLDLKDSATITLFPVIADDNIIGFVICDASSASQERVNLSKTYIESIANNTLGELLNAHIEILNPLSAQNISQMRQFAMLFKPTLARITPSVAIKQPQRSAGGPSNIDKILAYVQNNIRTPISLESLSQNVFLSPSYLSRLFKKYMHINFIDFVNYQKVALACKYLMTTRNKVSVISRQVGYSRNSYFSKAFKRVTGVSPLAYRRNHYVVQKVHTISRDLTWRPDDTIFDISRRYFKKLKTDFAVQSTDGAPYVNQIGGLTDSGSRGWVFTVDCQQPSTPADLAVDEKTAVIQWIYTTKF